MTDDTLFKEYLQNELKEYLVGKEVPPDKLKNLRSWVRKGNSVYTNPWFLYGENGRPLDYFTAEEEARNLCSEHAV